MTRLAGLRHLLVFEDCARGPDRGIGSVGMLHRPRCGLRRVTRHDAFLPRSVLDPPGAAVVAGPVRRALDVRHLDLRAHRTPDHGRSFPDHRDSWRRRAGGALGHGSVATREPQVRACCFSVLRFTAGRVSTLLPRPSTSTPSRIASIRERSGRRYVMLGGPTRADDTSVSTTTTIRLANQVMRC